MKPTKHTSYIVGLAIVGLALNLRPSMAAIGPLLDWIERATALSSTQAALLTTLPVFVMGLFSLFGRRGRSAIGERRGVALGAGLIIAACVMRLLLPTTGALIASAVVAGAGIAFIQALLPAFVKRSYPASVGLVMGLYTTGIMAGAAIAAASASVLADWFGWSAALGVWVLPAAAALLVWLAVAPPEGQQVVRTGRRVSESALWRTRRGWELLVFFGIGTGAYTLVLAWLPPFYTALGWSSADAGYLLGALTLTEVLAGLAVSALASRFPDRRAPLLLVLALLVAGLLCLSRAPLTLAVPACILLGIGIGALFPLSLILTLDHREDPEQAGELASFVQGGGYIIASLMPLVAGIIRDRVNDLSQAWTIMAAGVVLLALLCLRFSPASYRAPLVDQGATQGSAS